MAVLPEGFVLPPVPYLVAVLAVLIGVGTGLYRRRPAFGERHVLALVPWMIAGAALHVLYVLDWVPSGLAPFLGTPTVYVAVAAVAGAVWLGADVLGWPVPQSLGAVGAVGALGTVAAVGLLGVRRGSVRPGPSLAALALGIAIAVVAWWLLGRLRPTVKSVGWVGLVTISAHAIDGVSTAVGVDWLGFGERTPLSHAIIDFGAGLPPAGLLGDAWLFVLVKVLIATWIVAAFVEYVDQKPAEGYGLLGLVTAVGLGPAVHNLLLFAVA